MHRKDRWCRDPRGGAEVHPRLQPEGDGRGRRRLARLPTQRTVTAPRLDSDSARHLARLLQSHAELQGRPAQALRRAGLPEGGVQCQLSCAEGAE